MITPEGVDMFLASWVGIFILFALSAWSIMWKGLALWRAAKKSEKKWFILLLIINTVGILEILYLFVFSKQKEKTLEQQ
jgi:hypothetical protein